LYASLKGGDVKRQKDVVSLGPHVDPRVTNATALDYANRMRARKQQLNKGGEPVGGGQGPPIPLLTGEAQQHMTMADQAVAERMGAPPGSIVAPMGQPASPAQHGILPMDLLPAEARQDPAFREGMGGMYAAAQPALAKKYGVIRGSRRVPPHELEQGSSKPGVLRRETVEGLQKVAEFNQQRARVESGTAAGETRAEKEAESGLGGASAKLESGSAKPTTDKQREEAKKALSNMDEFDFNTFREMMMKDIINNDKQREIIEERCRPLDVGEVITKGVICQVVPVLPGVFEPEYQSYSAEDDLALKRLIMEEARTIAGEIEDRYLLDKFALMATTIGLKSINGHPLPSHRNSDGAFDEELFWKKFNKVIKLPFHMLASLGVNHFWFDIRVRKLFVAETVGNG